MKGKAKRIIISEASRSISYEDAKAFIDTCILEAAQKEKVKILCLKKQSKTSLAEQYANDRGFEVEYSSERFCKLLRLTDAQRMRKTVKSCDSLVLFFDEYNQEMKNLVRLAFLYGKPFEMNHAE